MLETPNIGSADDPLALAAELSALRSKQQGADKALPALKRDLDAGTITNAAFNEQYVALTLTAADCRRAVEITRILRRTNTGPAKAKVPSKTAIKKAEKDAKLADLLKGL